MTHAEMRESLELLPSWVLAQKAAANRQVIAVMRQRLAAGEQVARMYQAPGLAWLERQAEAAEQLLGERKPASRTSDVWSAAGAGGRQASLDRPGPGRAPLADSGASCGLGGVIREAGRGTAPGPAARLPGRGCQGRCRCS
jgi:hypothetical protein